jgi:hypothetical protein
LLHAGKAYMVKRDGSIPSKENIFLLPYIIQIGYGAHPAFEPMSKMGPLNISKVAGTRS